MKALVVRQPWASLIAHGIKTIETRGFAPRTSIEPGDQIAIVAGKAHGLPHYTLFADYSYTRSEDHGTLYNVDCESAPIPCPLGAVVAVVTFDDALPVIDHLRLVDGDDSYIANRGSRSLLGLEVVRNTPGRLTATTINDQLPLGDFTPGRYGWLLSNPQRLAAPVPCPAKRPDGTRTVMQGVFTLPDDVLEQVTPQLAREGSERT